MKSSLILMLLFASSVFADVSSGIIIRGKISNDFNQERVKVIDSQGQKYYLKTKYFPKDFKFQQGKEFYLEVPEEAVSELKLLK